VEIVDQMTFFYFFNSVFCVQRDKDRTQCGAAAKWPRGTLGYHLYIYTCIQFIRTYVHTHIWI